MPLRFCHAGDFRLDEGRYFAQTAQCLERFLAGAIWARIDTLDNQAPFQVEGIPMQALRIQSSVGNAEMRSLRMSRSLATPSRPTPVKLGPPQKHWVENLLLSIDRCDRSIEARIDRICNASTTRDLTVPTPLFTVVRCI